MLINISQEIRKFGAFTRRKENVANTAKETKHRIVRRATKKPLERNSTLKSSRRLHINEIDGGRD
jgi:hypothetical protein